MRIWFEILSELFVNLSAGWFALVFIEPLLADTTSFEQLILRLLAGIVSVAVAKRFREESKII